MNIVSFLSFTYFQKSYRKDRFTHHYKTNAKHLMFFEKQPYYKPAFYYQQKLIPTN